MEKVLHLLFFLWIELPYEWKQTLGDLDLSLPLPQGTRGKDVDVVLGKNHLKAGLKNKAYLINVHIG